MIAVILTVIIAMSVLVVASFAAETWSNPGTYQLTKGDDWKRNTTEGVYLVNTKTTDSSRFDVYTISLTMWNNPSFRLVNSENEARSRPVTIANAGRQKEGSNSTAVKGYNYYASLKPDFLQTKTDTARIQFKSR